MHPAVRHIVLRSPSNKTHCDLHVYVIRCINTFCMPGQGELHLELHLDVHVKNLEPSAIEQMLAVVYLSGCSTLGSAGQSEPKSDHAVIALSCFVHGTSAHADADR
jgi:hypothetical protein